MSNHSLRSLPKRELFLGNVSQHSSRKTLTKFISLEKRQNRKNTSFIYKKEDNKSALY